MSEYAGSDAKPGPIAEPGDGKGHMNQRLVVRAALLSAGCMWIGAELARAQEPTPSKNAYFGQTHVHTSWSFDAYVFGNMVTGPEDAYKYALGRAVKHPAGYMVKLKRPHDFKGVTDHAEYVGTVKLANEPGSTISKLPIDEKLKVRNQEDIQMI